MKQTACAATIVAVAILINGCTASVPHSPATVATSEPVEVMKQGGCIGKALDACLENLQSGFQFGPYQNIADEIRRNEAVDVTGKRIAHKNIIVITGNLKGWDTLTGSQSIDLTYTDDKVVNYIEISLPGDPALANTEDEYRKTGLYEGAALLLGSSCPTLERAEIYKFFQTAVKPKIVREGKKIEIHDTSAETRNFAKTPQIPFCNQHFSYTNLFGVDTNYISSTNSSGVYFRTAIAFEPNISTQDQKRQR